MSLLPSESEREPPEGEPRVVGVDDEDAERLLAALSAETSRTILSELHESPRTASELAEQVDTTLQNAQYHLGKLQDAELVEVHDTRYSEKGREMNVYAPSAAPLVLFAGPESESEDVRSTLTSLLGGVGVLALASVAVQALLAPGGLSFGGSAGAGGDAATGGEATTTASQSGGGFSAASVETTTTAAREGAGTLAALPPGALFFLGGLFVLIVLGVVWAARRR
ncbi:ArsR/SmtB family transcription factor [Halospeciosus flavus]|uniref:ArsR/SmtB family transcription factor n=1 Tax=Halospeciosus flavus TaxID=3032283 RepID=A0ABD5Z764_9EURY|nr:winged helix-turn-helix domain-containing protein [Halospeciosus flavus]